jgi:hypothetical protein
MDKMMRSIVARPRVVAMPFQFAIGEGGGP